MKTPCDEAVVRSIKAAVPCTKQAGRWLLAATILGSSMAFIDTTVVNVALPALQSNLHATVIGVQWVVEAYGLFLGSLILAGGSFGDMFGRRRTFLSGVIIFAVASIGCGFSANIQQLVIARSVQGIGAAFLVPGSLSIISANFDEKTRGKAIGTWSGFTAITTAIGPVLGGWLIEHASWRWAFFINVPIAVAVIAISLWQIPESRNPDVERVDWAGALLATTGLGGLVFGLVESSSLGWNNPLVSGSLICGCVSLIFFMFVEDKVNSPMVPLKLFRSPSFSGANLLTLFLYSALGIFLFLFPMNLIQVQHYSSTAAGAAALPLILLLFSLSRWSGGLEQRYGAKLPLITGPAISAIGFVLFAVPGTGTNYWTAYFPAFLVLGFGMAISVAPLTTVVMGSVEQDRAGAASGVNNAVARVASVMAVAILGIVMVKLFSASLNRSLANELVPPSILDYIHGNEIRLAGIVVPPGADSCVAEIIQSSISRAFVFGFRTIMLICAGLAFASAGVASLMIPAKNK